MVPWRIIFFGVNVAVCLGWIVLTIQFVNGSELSVFAFLFGAIMAAPAVAVGVAEWLLFARHATRLERPLGILAGFIGALSLFGFVANAGEAVVKGESAGVLFWLGFGGICLTIAAYGFWCCWLRVHRRTLPQQRGFPIGDATK
jgi:hypothetical protein